MTGGVREADRGGRSRKKGGERKGGGGKEGKEGRGRNGGKREMTGGGRERGRQKEAKIVQRAKGNKPYVTCPYLAPLFLPFPYLATSPLPSSFPRPLVLPPRPFPPPPSNKKRSADLIPILAEIALENEEGRKEIKSIFPGW